MNRGTSEGAGLGGNPEGTGEVLRCSWVCRASWVSLRLWRCQGVLTESLRPGGLQEGHRKHGGAGVSLMPWRYEGVQGCP